MKAPSSEFTSMIIGKNISTSECASLYSTTFLNHLLEYSSSNSRKLNHSVLTSFTP